MLIIEYGACTMADKKAHLFGKPFNASSNTSGVLSVPCGTFFAHTSTYLSSSKRSSSESTCKNNHLS